MKTEYLQNDQDILAVQYDVCDSCLVKLTDVYEPNRYGHYELYGAYEANGDLYGFLCPDCAKNQAEN